MLYWLANILSRGRLESRRKVINDQQETIQKYRNRLEDCEELESAIPPVSVDLTEEQKKTFKEFVPRHNPKYRRFKQPANEME